MLVVGGGVGGSKGGLTLATLGGNDFGLGGGLGGGVVQCDELALDELHSHLLEDVLELGATL